MISVHEFKSTIKQFYTQVGNSQERSQKINLLNNLFKFIYDNFEVITKHPKKFNGSFRYAILSKILEFELQAQFEYSDLLKEKILEDGFLMLGNALVKQDMDIIKYITNNININEFLIYSVEKGDLQLVKHAIENGADLKYKNSYALKVNQIESIDSGIDIPNKLTILEFQELVDQGYRANLSLLDKLANMGNVEFLKIHFNKYPQDAKNVSLFALHEKVDVEVDEEVQNVLLQYGHEPTRIKDLFKIPVSFDQYSQSLYKDTDFEIGDISEISKKFGDLEIEEPVRIVSNLQSPTTEYEINEHLGDLNIFDEHTQYLNENSCFGVKYCDILYTYTYKGDRFINDQLANLKSLDLVHLKHLRMDHGSFVYTILKLLNLEPTFSNYEKGILELGKIVNNMIIKSPPLPVDMTLYRGVKRELEMKQIPFTQEAQYINLSGIMSSSVDIRVAKLFGAKGILVLLIPAESKGLMTNDCSHFVGEEEEIVLPHGCHWIVTDVQEMFNDVYDEIIPIISLLLVKQPKAVQTICDI